MLETLRNRRSLWKFVFLAGNIFLLLFIVVLKIPFAFSNFWAEDGVFYQQAVDNAFLGDFFISGGGYLIFISRIVANFVAVGPVDYAPFINTIIVISVLGFLTQRLYINLKYLLKSKIYNLLVCLSVLLLPINNFETIASGTALHFQLLFVVLVMALVARKESLISNIDTFVIVIALLSDPFTFLALVPLFFRHKYEVIRFWKKRGGKLTLLTLSLVLQLVMMVLFHLKDDRALGVSHSFAKTGYMFLDRVVGSTFIPNWGLISFESFAEGKITINLIARAATGLLCLGYIGIFVVRHLRKSLDQGEVHTKETLIWLILMPSFYWFAVGVLFNPEPRYAVFPGLSILLVALILIDHLTCESKSKIRNSVIACIVLIFTITNWLLSASPSQRRIEGPDWHSQIVHGKLECKTLSLDSVLVKILPIDDHWKIEMQCQVLLGK